MTINGKRYFTYNGKKYYIANLPKQDRIEKKKYYVCFVTEDGFFKSAYNRFGWELEKFETIKQAQIYVRDWDFALDTLY